MFYNPEKKEKEPKKEKTPLFEKMTRNESKHKEYRAEGGMGIVAEHLELIPMLLLFMEDYGLMKLKSKFPCKFRKKTMRSEGLAEDKEDDIVVEVGYIQCDAKYNGKSKQLISQCFDCDVVGSHAKRNECYLQYHMLYGNYYSDMEHIELCKNGVKPADRVVDDVTGDIKEKKSIFKKLKDDVKDSVDEEVSDKKAEITKTVDDATAIETPDIVKPASPEPSFDIDKLTPEERKALMKKLLE